MNRQLPILFLFCFIIILKSCDRINNSKTANQEAKEIITLNENKATKEYFETLEEVIDEYATMMAKISEASKVVPNINGDANFTDAMSMLNDIASSTMKMAPLLDKMSKLEKEAEVLKKDMTAEEIEAFSKSYLKIMNRFYEMSNKTNKN
jgi:prophage DNA circulation protein